MEYKLLNNHYVVDIEGYKFLIDTGNPYSFFVNQNIDHIAINGDVYRFRGHNRLNTEEKRRKTCELIGCDRIDGFIGTDIIEKYGLTIYKNGELEFAIKEVTDGLRTQLHTAMAGTNPNWGPYYLVQARSNGVSGMMLVDLGATFGYAIPEAFYGEEPYSKREHDYNPERGDMYSPMYNQEVMIAERKRTMQIGLNDFPIENGPLCRQVPFVGSVTNFFDEVCVFDTKRKLLILK